MVKHFNFFHSLLFSCLVTVFASASPVSANSSEDLAQERIPDSRSFSRERIRTRSLVDYSKPTNLESSYRRAWKLLKDNTMYPERLINWDVWEHKYDGKLQSEKELERAINQMVRQVGDQYTYFRDHKETQERSLTDTETGVVSWQLLDGEYGYVSIRTFASTCVASELQVALMALAEAKSIILDLRNNKGGYVDQALLCFSAMVDAGKFVTIKGRQDGIQYTEDIQVTEGEVLRVVNQSLTREPRVENLTGHKQIIVLINNGTRSASEMLAGALRDVRQARLIGSKTFGKGVVQGSWRLDPGCSIKIAMARFFLPAGASINGKGIMPDIAADFDGETGNGSSQDIVMLAK